LPLLKNESTGFQIAQSVAIARYLARIGNLLPSNAEDAAIADMIVDGVSDWKNAGYNAWFAPQEEKEQKLKDFRDVKCPFFLDKFEALLQNGGSEFFVGGKLSWADLAVFECLESFDHLVGVDKHPLLAKLRATVEARPNIKKYLSDPHRPKNFGSK